MSSTIYDEGYEDVYSSVDPFLEPWAARKRLKLTKLYKNEYVVRSMDIPHPRKTFQLWIDAPEDGSIRLHCCDHASPWESRIGCSLLGPVSMLEQMLDEMYAWIHNQA